MSTENTDTMNDAVSDDWAQALEEQASATDSATDSAPAFETISPAPAAGGNKNPMQRCV